MINIGLLGLGTVGTGVVEILAEREKEISLLLGKELNIKKVLVKNINKKRDVKLKPDTIVSDFNEILNDDEISIVIEVTSDVDTSYEYIKAALNKGKAVVTANKALVSKYFEELSSLADEKGVSFLYEASVGGGIPILKPLKEELILNEITDVQGILNGTCNYILTRMFNEGLDYGEVLANAQELGYAEMNPAADVEGDDTLRKLRILASLALQGKVGEEDIILEGINKITSFDVRQIKLMDSTVKLIGEVEELADLVEVVHAILDYKKISIEDFNKIREKKNEARGLFKEGLLLLEVLEDWRWHYGKRNHNYREIRFSC